MPNPPGFKVDVTVARVGTAGGDNYMQVSTPAVLSISPTADGPFRLPISSKSSVTGKHLARWKATSPTADHSAAQRYQAATMASFTPTTVPKETLRYPAGHSVA
ncbi:hypothetical protein CH63R_08439 [Colletotrichum higginsianum IMI 349063]|uniref:Uncharacterized protein n=1 Tax=Colletotrichum higginsianum (strain IMI 349063) TaxID=759273 RepID=A0A1B7Y4K7_COLHI|nr:hypothetical protein CH63R_08439 [Colletotrichum higginsianum IMI 349063]OBR06918.1 hypothetical protein CH63R_08439 [Colletotrichum higginsianum IMI 349063]